MLLEIDVTLSLRLQSEANMRDHWSAKARRTKEQRDIVKMALWRYCQPIRNRIDAWNGPISIVITRIGPRALDKDNAYRSAKAVTDGIADALKIDDGDDRLHWKVHQKKGRSNEYAVNIYITPLPS